jgi:predicted MFS family arabinose efflux permease
LVGAGAVVVVPFAGRFIDKAGSERIIVAAALLMLASFIILFGFRFHLAGLVLGIFTIEIAAHSSNISNQTSLYSLPQKSSSRFYTVYRAAYSIGGAMGAYLGIYSWSIYGWTGVCCVGIGLVVLALLHQGMVVSSIFRSIQPGLQKSAFDSN